MIAVRLDGRPECLLRFKFGFYAYQFEPVYGDRLMVCRGVHLVCMIVFLLGVRTLCGVCREPCIQIVSFDPPLILVVSKSL
ncbi:hypothetical protein KSAC_34960 (plasmid) [Komagataeibacter saccharivorans]|nr:hypothetical protein KSAC_34960 [Komagataeibacter saccharivorans]